MKTRTIAISIAAFLFFLSVQWYGIYFMMYNHPGPLGIDDALAYIANIEFRIAPPAEYVLIPDRDQVLFSVAYGNLARMLGISATAMFHANFYIGLFLMGLVLLLFLRKTDPSPFFVATALCIFAFYEGKGTYHGFFWVVPSFYAIMFFLISATTLFYSKHRILYSIPPVTLMLLTHSTGLYLAVVLFAALIIQEGFFLKHWKRLNIAIFSGAALFLLVILAENLHGIGLFPYSFTKIILSKLDPDARELFSSGASWSTQLGFMAKELRDTVVRHDFVKYFYGIYTPLLAYGFYHVIKGRKYPLASIFIAVLAGQLATAPISDQSYRFFYPLEIVTWMVIAYAVAKILEDIFDPEKRRTMGTSHKTITGILLSLSLLLVYNAAYKKAGHEWFFKFYNPRYCDSDALGNWLYGQSGKSLAVYTPQTYQGFYLGLPGGYRDHAFRFNISGNEIAAAPEKWLVIGETRQYAESARPEFRAYWPLNSRLKLKTPVLPPGRYKLELIDTGIDNPNQLKLSADGKTYANWKSRAIDIQVPEEGCYPPLMLPWYRFSQKPWVLHNRPLNDRDILRTSLVHDIEFSIEEQTESLELLNNRGPLFILGTVQITNLETNSLIALDLYRDDAESINQSMVVEHDGLCHPLYWRCAKYGPGPQLLFRLEKNFTDVKAFSFHTEHKNL